MPDYFYYYQAPSPAGMNIQSQGHWENPADWPRTFFYVPNNGSTQGIHPPAPVYQSNQPSQQAVYYFAGSTTAPAGYYVNGLYYGTSPPPSLSNGWPYSSSLTCYPFPSANSTSYSACTYTYSPYYVASQPPQQQPVYVPNPCPWSQAAATAQAAAVLAANATLAAQPNAPKFVLGPTTAEVQNAIYASNVAAQQLPNQIAPFKPGQSQQFWCKELDGSWTLGEFNDSVMGSLGPGHWERHSNSGYYYYVKKPA